MKTLLISGLASLFATYASAYSLTPTNTTIAATGPFTFSGHYCSSASMTIKIDTRGIGKITAITCPSMTFTGLPWNFSAISFLYVRIHGVAGTVGSDVCAPQDRRATIDGAKFTISGRGPCNIYAEMVTTPAMSIVP